MCAHRSIVGVGTLHTGLLHCWSECIWAGEEILYTACVVWHTHKCVGFSTPKWSHYKRWYLQEYNLWNSKIPHVHSASCIQGPTCFGLPLALRWIEPCILWINKIFCMSEPSCNFSGSMVVFMEGEAGNMVSNSTLSTAWCMERYEIHRYKPQGKCVTGIALGERTWSNVWNPYFDHASFAIELMRNSHSNESHVHDTLVHLCFVMVATRHVPLQQECEAVTS